MSTDTPHITALSTAFVRELPYRFWTRFRDGWLVGRRDGAADLAHESVEGVQPSASLRELSAIHQQRCELERLSATRIAAPLMDRRRQLARRTADLAREKIELSDRLRQHENAPDPDASVVRASEAHLAPEQRAGRRARERTAALAPLRQRIARIADEESATFATLAEIDGKLTTLFEGLQARASSLTHYYERRCDHQIRAYLRRSPAPDGATHPLNARHRLANPDWALAPNPWLATVDTVGAA